MRTRYTLISCAIFLALLSGCSGSDTARQADSNFDYLELSQVAGIKQNINEKIPTSPIYAVPRKNVLGKLGKQVDIYPPVEILELIPGTRSRYHNNKVVVQASSSRQLNEMWYYILQGMKEERASIKASSSEFIESDWVDLSEGIGDAKELVRYRVEKPKGSRQRGFNVSLVGWQNAPKALFAAEPNRAKQYTIKAANKFLTYYDVAKTNEARRKAQEIIRTIPMQMGVDTSALPIVIARIPFDVFWERVPSLLAHLGMTAHDRLRSQGVIEVENLPPSDSQWSALGIKPWLLVKNEYRLHIGDLKNRTSISVTTKLGKPVSEEELKSFMVGLKAATDYDNKLQK